MLRAVPSMIFMAASTSLALRSGILSSAISRTFSRDTVPTLARLGSPEPLGMPSASRSSTAAGGVLVMNENERSSNTVISTGTMVLPCAWVCALKFLQNSMMLTPCWPSAGPTGGAGLAAPAGICNLITAASFFFLGGMRPLASGAWFGWSAGIDQQAGISTSSKCSLNLGHLVERQLDRRLPAEDRHQHLELLGVRVDLVDGGGQRGERPVGDLDRLTHLVVQLYRLLRGLPGRRSQDLGDLADRERARARGLADEAGHPRRVADRGPRLVGQVHPYQQVAREDLALNQQPLAPLDLRDLLG